ncbi:MAG: class I SAM-dependent methyltransferase [Candidatus Marsarchaeota archaeon]|nr:class I SAM-dependent methyltransferase [Candidatus Marsarchaeota archaeon]
MKDLYLPGEERFGPVSSALYSFGAKLWPITGFYRFVVRDMSNANGKSILDVGTGAGDIPIALANLNKFDIYAIDPSPNMIAIAKRRSANLKNISFAMGSSRQVTFKRRFDIIIACLTFHHWKEKGYSLGYLSSFLKKNGELRIYEYRNDALKYTPMRSHTLNMHELDSVLKGTGLVKDGILAEGSHIRVTLKRRKKNGRHA